MMVNLPIDLLRSFTAIVDAGSMQRAADIVFVTQSALSLQMKRLEDLVQTALFNRDGRKLTLTPAGQSMLVHAREILAANDRAVTALNGDALAGPARIGFVQDFAEPVLDRVLPGFSRLAPQAQLQVRVGMSAELLELMQAGRLDVILGMGAQDDPAAIRKVPMQWLGRDELAQQEILPLALLERPCRFRDAAVAALEQAGRAYRIVLETPSLAALRAAVNSGLGLTCRTLHAIDSAVTVQEALPTLPRVAYVLQVRSNPHSTIAQLAELVSATVRAL